MTLGAFREFGRIAHASRCDGPDAFGRGRGTKNGASLRSRSGQMLLNLLAADAYIIRPVISALLIERIPRCRWNGDTMLWLTAVPTL